MKIKHLAIFGVLLLLISGAPLLATPFVTIQPVQICDDAGLNCANSAQDFLLAEGQKIWDQAGITLDLLPWITYNNTDFLDMSATYTTDDFGLIIDNPTAYNGSADPQA